MRTIATVTVARSDYGIYRPVLRRMAATEGLAPRLFVAGSHLDPARGETVKEIESDGFAIAERIATMAGPGDRPLDMGRSMANAVAGFARAWETWRPDLILVLGDRFEMFAAAASAAPFNIPLAHIHGGELTLGAIDDGFRHAITKLSHLHFAATEEFSRRVKQMGEEDWRVTVSGAPALDELATYSAPSRRDTLASIGLTDAPFLLVTFHPETLRLEETPRHIEEVAAALEASRLPFVATAPGLDASARSIAARLEALAERIPGSRFEPSLGADRYRAAMAHAAAMVGNSSSGIIEAASLRTPVVDIGDRQTGRPAPENVVRVPIEREAILAAIGRVTEPAFRDSLANLVNPYGDGRAAERIVARLASVPFDRRLLFKRFADRDRAGERQ